MSMTVAPKASSEAACVAALFGGASGLGHSVDGPFDAHELLLHGLPSGALQNLLDNLQILKRTVSLEKAVGMSLRTFQRHKDEPKRPLTAAQSGRAWKFAEILASATRVFGSQREAELWLEEPALGLNGHRPIDLLGTPAGVEMVETLLGRIEYGVYT